MRISDWSSDVCLPILADHGAVIAFCRENEIDLVVIGPEQPLVEGLANALAQAGIKAFGPSAKAAQLEGSKGFTKDLCARAGIPTAAYARFDSAEAARAYLATQPVPVVIKADGLAAGKGVVIATTPEGNSDERRGGKGAVRKRRSRWSSNH